MNNYIDTCVDFYVEPHLIKAIIKPEEPLWAVNVFSLTEGTWPGSSDPSFWDWGANRVHAIGMTNTDDLPFESAYLVVGRDGEAIWVRQHHSTDFEISSILQQGPATDFLYITNKPPTKETISLPHYITSRNLPHEDDYYNLQQAAQEVAA